MYKVILTKRALKDLESLTEEIKMRIIGKLREYSHNPFTIVQNFLTPELERIGLESEISELFSI
jgi:mRNA-degrading endonuclease RelE of RelBE toxin-antitoxin system